MNSFNLEKWTSRHAACELPKDTFEGLSDKNTFRYSNICRNCEDRHERNGITGSCDARRRDALQAHLENYLIENGFSVGAEGIVAGSEEFLPVKAEKFSNILMRFVWFHQRFKDLNDQVMSGTDFWHVVFNHAMERLTPDWMNEGCHGLKLAGQNSNPDDYDENEPTCLRIKAGQKIDDQSRSKSFFQHFFRF